MRVRPRRSGRPAPIELNLTPSWYQVECEERSLLRSRLSGSCVKQRSNCFGARRSPKTCRKIGVTEQTYYRWKKEDSGLRIDQAKKETMRSALIVGSGTA